MSEEKSQEKAAPKAEPKQEKAAPKAAGLVALIKTVKGQEFTMNARPEQVEALLRDPRFRKA